MTLEEKIQEIETQCEKVRVTLAEEPDVTPAEATFHSAYALETALRIVRVLRDIKDEIIKIEVLKSAAYGKAFESLDNKLNVSKMKALASKDKDYLKQDILLKKSENAVDYFKGMYDVCMDSHKFYKSQMV